MSKIATRDKFRTENVAPEGGIWGYLVVIGVSLPLGCCFGSFASFGLMYNDFLVSLGAGTSAVTIITSSFWGAVSFSGLFASILFKKYSMRSVGLLGGTLYFVGSFLTIFATSVEYMIITFGILQGTGVGIIFSVGYTTLNHYFVKRRVFVMSVTSTLQSIITTVYPIFVQFLMNKYGFRGTLAIIAAITAHAILGMMAMHPIEWHYKVIRTPIVDESNSVMSDSEKDLKINMKSMEKCTDAQQKDTCINMTNVNQDCEKTDIEETGELDSFDPIKTHIPSVMSVRSMGDAVVAQAVERAKHGKWQKVVDFLDLTLLKDWIYVNIAIGLTTALYSDGAFFLLLPMYLFELGFSQKEAAVITSTVFAAELSCRTLMAIVSLFIQFKARNAFLFGCITCTLFRFALLNTFSFTGTILIAATIGFFRAFLHLNSVLAFAEYLTPQRFPSGYGLFLFLQGVLSFLLSPTTGWIRDVTQSYVICFHSLTVIMGICVIPWIIEMIWNRMKNSRKTLK